MKPVLPYLSKAAMCISTCIPGPKMIAEKRRQVVDSISLFLTILPTSEHKHDALTPGFQIARYQPLVTSKNLNLRWIGNEYMYFVYCIKGNFCKMSAWVVSIKFSRFKFS